MEHITYLEISYPNFVLGQIIDPEEANQNNHDLQAKINDTIISNNELIDRADDLELRKATIVYVDEEVGELTDAFILHKTSSDHDTKYYTKSEAASKAELNLKANKEDTYTKEELAPWLSSGDTVIREEVFIIDNTDLGDDTFRYTRNGVSVLGEIGDGGEQIFTLFSGNYQLGLNRIECMVNDTLRRSVVSGGLREVNETKIALTQPEGPGAEITFKYYERVGVVEEYNLKLSELQPPLNAGKTMWFEVI